MDLAFPKVDRDQRTHLAAALAVLNRADGSKPAGRR